jgi:hypothetical protein
MSAAHEAAAEHGDSELFGHRFLLVWSELGVESERIGVGWVYDE